MNAKLAGSGADTTATQIEPGANDAAAAAAAPSSTDRLAALVELENEATGGSIAAPKPPQTNGEEDPDGDQAQRPQTGSADGKTGAAESESAGAEGDEPTETEEGAAAAEVTDEERTNWPPEVLPRIHKITAQREEARTAQKAAEDRAAALEADVKRLAEEAKANRPVLLAPTKADPLADVMDEQQLASVIADSEKAIQMAIDNPDGAEDQIVGYKMVDDPDKPGAKIKQPILEDLSAADMQRLKAFHERILRSDVPARREYITAQKGVEEVAKADYPELFKKDTPDHAFYEDILRTVPEAMRVPHFSLLIGWANVGRKLWLAENAKKAAAQGAGKIGNAKPVSKELQPFLQKQPAKAPGTLLPRGDVNGGGTGATRVTKETVEKAKERVLSGGGEEAEVDFIGSLRGAQAGQNAALV